MSKKRSQSAMTTPRYVFIIAALVFYGVSVLVAYHFGRQTTIWPTPDHQPPKSIACTLDAMICPDGSTVGRIGPNCDFAPCPTQAAGTPVPTKPPVTGYRCPTTEMVDCMPTTDGGVRTQCMPAYLTWAKQNCPGFQGAAY